MSNTFDTIRGQPLIRRPVRSLLIRESRPMIFELVTGPVSPPVSAPSTPAPPSHAAEIQPSDYANFVITPISADPKNKANIDYLEQLERIQDGHPLVWDDTKHNKSLVGDLFGFWMYKKRVKVHVIQAVSTPDQRLPSWHANVGQSDRNVLTLSSEYFVIDWDQWISMGGAKRCMGTATAKKSLENVLELSRSKF